MCLGADTMTAFQGKEIPWLQGLAWRAEGADQSVFLNGTLPMERILLSDARVIPMKRISETPQDVLAAGPHLVYSKRARSMDAAATTA